ncbi:MAG: response regulator [Xylanivirga thermophila]|jgi:two-component system, response regulator YesN|uniref:response regulator transcription factor n=1 Tax=Xylanivirga thermophila TaxID=2496273 RepID=UPI00101D4268|nr:response regulator [Xylanivirga thermophila]
MDTTCRILIVEDELISRQALRYIIGLEKDIFEIVGECSNGKEALDMIEMLRPHVVISDIVMPVMDGVELTKIINLKYPDIFVIVISGHNEFDYVKPTLQYGIVDYILKPQLEPEVLLCKLKNIAQKLNIKITPKGSNDEISYEEIIYHLISGRVLNIPPKEMCSYFSNSQFCLCGCSISRIMDTDIIKENIILDTITNIAEDILSDVDYHWIVFNHRTRFLIMLNFEKGEYQNIKNKISNMVRKIAEDIPTIFLAVSDEYSDVLKTYDRAKMIERLIDMRFYIKDQNIIFEKDINYNKPLPILDNKKYIDSIRLFHLDEGFNYLLNFMNLVKESKAMKSIELKKILENTIYNTIISLEDMGISDDELNIKKMEFFSQIENALDMDELLAAMDDIFAFLRVKVAKYRKIDAELFYKIEAYIRNNYKDQISLDVIADKFHISYSYLSSYFSNYAHMGINEYLNDVRIQKAKELLITTNIPIGDISEMVGYSDQSYFGKVFKKLVGMNPSTYRKGHKKL